MVGPTKVSPKPNIPDGENRVSEGGDRDLADRKTARRRGESETVAAVLREK
jgi:hypothetical protein